MRAGRAITESVDYFQIPMLANRRERDETNVTNDNIGRLRRYDSWPMRKSMICTF
jgi:hypothetical protein